MSPQKAFIPPDPACLINVMDLRDFLVRCQEDPGLLIALQKDPDFLRAVGKTRVDLEGLMRRTFDGLQTLNQLVSLGRGRIRLLATARQGERTLGAEADLRAKMMPYFSGDGEKSPLGMLQFARAQGIPIILPDRLQPDWHSYNPERRIGEVFQHGGTEYAVTAVKGGISLFFKAASGWLQVHTYYDEVASFFGEPTDRELNEAAGVGAAR